MFFKHFSAFPDCNPIVSHAKSVNCVTALECQSSRIDAGKTRSLGLHLQETILSGMQDKTLIASARHAATDGPVARIALDNGISFNVEAANLPLLIGRSADSDICIPSGHVSRHHCELYMVNGVLCLKDTSSNGTVVDNRTVRQESISIQSTATVVFAGEVKITITPSDGSATPRTQPPREERRGGDRRGDDRRQKKVIVNFERRVSEDRRTGDRRD